MAEDARPEAFAYVDAYNLYYGLRDSCGRGAAGWRWLDLAALMRRLVPEWHVTCIYYFTAYINPPEWSKAKRQKRLIRALATIPEFTLILGRYRADPAEFPLLENPDQMVRVLHTEEKETDVNLAVQLVVDGLIDGACDNFVVVTNDSDQVSPIRLLRGEGLNVGILNPHKGRPSTELKNAASWMRAIRPANVLACQFPDEVEDAAGRFSKPPSW